MIIGPEDKFYISIGEGKSFEKVWLIFKGNEAVVMCFDEPTAETIKRLLQEEAAREYVKSIP